MYDLIGDIHGHASILKLLLYKMGYREENGVWKHPSHKAIFVGDYIDRGPEIRETLRIVRSMQESGHAFALMGNHEYNALAYHFERPDGSHLRKHSDTNNRQHEQTIHQFADHQQEWQSYLEWFYTLPLFIELPELRAIHACWDQEHIDWLTARGHHTMSESLLIQSHKKDSREYQVIEDILKGKEYNIPQQYAWKDKDGHIRTENRIKWWLDANAATYGQFLFNCPQHLKEEMIKEEIEYVVYPANAKPVFFGHYWMEDTFPIVQADNVVCLDYSIAKGGSLVAYRWNGEQTVNNAHFVSESYS